MTSKEKEELKSFFKWDMSEILDHLERDIEKEPKSMANKWAVDNPDKEGIITVKKSLGRAFFWIKNGKSAAIDAIDAFRLIKGR